MVEEEESCYLRAWKKQTWQWRQRHASPSLVVGGQWQCGRSLDHQHFNFKQGRHDGPDKSRALAAGLSCARCPVFNRPAAVILVLIRCENKQETTTIRGGRSSPLLITISLQGSTLVVHS